MSLFRFCVSVLVDFLKICLLHEIGQVTSISLLIHVESCFLRFTLTDNFFDMLSDYSLWIYFFKEPFYHQIFLKLSCWLWFLFI